MRRRLFFFVGALFIVQGCQNQSEPNAKNNPVHREATPFLKEEDKVMLTKQFSYITVNNAPFYKDGPQQGRPADGIFTAGTKLRVIRNAGSYSLVESLDGVQAYVAVNDIERNN